MPAATTIDVLAGLDVAGGRDHGLHAREADGVDRHRGSGERDARGDSRLPDRTLPTHPGQHLTAPDALDLDGLDGSSGERGADRVRGQIGGRDVGEPSGEA